VSAISLHDFSFALEDTARWSNTAHLINQTANSCSSFQFFDWKHFSFFIV
jgi:hypothetical protein